MPFNKVDIFRKGQNTKIKINDKEVTGVSSYKLGQDTGDSIIYLTIKMAIDEKKSTITIEDD